MPTYRIAAVAALLTTGLLAQNAAWSSTDNVPSRLDFLYYDAARQLAVGLSSYPSGGWAHRNGRWAKWDAMALPTSPGNSADVLLLGYDEVGGRAVAVGRFPGQYQYRTYVQVGSAWQQLFGAPPPLVSAASVAFDAAAGALLVFGGLDGAFWAPTNTTSRWTASGWSTVTTANAPAPRYAAPMAFDRARNRMVLFGGDDGTGSLGDTWEFDGANWTPIAAGGPTARVGHLIWDPAAQRVALLGGYANWSTPLTDCWEWTGAQWVARPAIPPGTTGRGWSDATSIVLLGERGDTWRRTGSGWTLQPGNGNVVSTLQPAMAYDPVGGEVVLHAGYPSDVTYAWRGRWQPLVTGNGPGVRYEAAMASYGPGMVLFGGVLQPYGIVSDTWRWNGASWQFTLPNNWPQARSRHRMTSTGTSALLHGGMGSMGPLDDLWEYDGVDWTQRTAPLEPPRRHDHGFAYDPIRQRAVIYGGYDRQVQLADVWEWDGAQWTQGAPVASPPPHPFELAFDATRGRIVAPVQGEMWEWDGAQWTFGGSSARYDSSANRFAFDVARSRLLGYGYAEQTWVYGPTPQVAEIVSYGCGNEALLTLMGCPAPGEVPDLYVETGAGTLVAMALGLTPTAIPWVPGCIQIVQPSASVFGVTATTGAWSLPFALPNQPVLRGLDVRAQAVVLDGGTSLGVSFSNGLRIVVGD